MNRARPHPRPRPRPRLCLVVPGFASSLDDDCIPAARELALELAATHDVTVVALRYPHTAGAAAHSYAVGPLRVMAIGGATVQGVGRLALLRRAVSAVRRLGPFDVVQGLWADEPGLVAALAGRSLGARVVVSFMGGELAALPAVPYGGQLERLGPHLVWTAATLADELTVGSRWLGERVPERWRAKTRLMPLPVHPAFSAVARPTTRRRSGPLQVGLVASLLPVKAPGLLLAASQLARKRGAELELTMIGEGPLRPRLTRQAARLDVPCAFTGQVPHASLPERLARIDVVVQTSWWESQGMAVLEARAAGCALLGTAVGALAHLDDALARTPPGQVAPLAEALWRAANR